MAAKNKEYIANEGHVARTEGAGAMEVAYKTKMLRSVLFIDTNKSVYHYYSSCYVLFLYSGNRLRRSPGCTKI